MSRFYAADGTCIEGLRAARKLTPLPLPSVSTVLSLLMSQGLVRYFNRQMFEATATTPRQSGQSDDEYFEACAQSAAEHSKAARDAGSELHDLIQSYNLARKFQKPVPRPPERWAGQYRSYVGWYEEHVVESLAVEEVLFGDGYAGRVDHVCLLRDGRIACVDAKTQGLKGKKAFNHYINHFLQLAAYAGSFTLSQQKEVGALVSLYFSSDDNKWESFEWPEPISKGLAIFKSLADYWRLENDYV